MTSTNYQRKVMAILDEFANKQGIDKNFLKVCDECGRIFDMLDEIDSQEWFYGHDCEPCGCGKCVKYINP